MLFRRLSGFYSRRIVNVNVNIVLAGFLALGPTLLVVRLVEHLLNRGLSAKLNLHITDKAIITCATFIADLVFDVSIYFFLHWLANHWRKPQPRLQHQMETIADAAVESVPFFKDATKVQMQRLVLSPALYIIFLGGQFSLMTWGHLRPVWATIIGFAAGIAVARTLHTFWMLGEARGRAAVLAGKICGKCGRDLSGSPTRETCPECGFRIPRMPTPNGSSPPSPEPTNGKTKDESEEAPAERPAEPKAREPVSRD